MALFGGSRLVGMDRFDAESMLCLIERHHVTWVNLVPAMMHRIWALPRRIRERYDVSSLETVWHMAAPCPVWLKRAWIDWLGAEKIWELYGGTETFGATVIRGDEWLNRPGSVGKSIGGRIRIADEAGQDCKVDEIGEIFFEPPSAKATPTEYIGAQPRMDVSGWYSFGDLGRLDHDGYLFLADRRTDLILRGGANIYPAEIEAALDAYPDVASSLVIGLSSEDLGQRVHALIEPRAGSNINLQALQIFLAERLAKYKLPESYELVDHPLRDDAGKARRTAIRAERERWLVEGRSFATRSGRF